MSTTVQNPFESLRSLLSADPERSYKLVACDMDGTLLNEEHRMTERTIATLQKISAQGVTVMLATGCMMAAVTDHLELLGTPGLAVCHNGALVKDIRTGRIYHHEMIERDVLDRVLQLAQAKQLIIHLNYDDDIYLTRPNRYSEQFAKELGVKLTIVNSFSEIEGLPTSILLKADKDTLDAILQTLQEAFPQRFDHVLIPWTDGYWQLQFLPANTSKGKGVLRAAALLGIAPEEIISFGDSYNDMDMIASTGLGIAMGNAVPELREAARFVTLSHREDGVAQTLEVIFS